MAEFEKALQILVEASSFKDSILKGTDNSASPGDAVETCTILTTAASETVAPLHGRMPVILPPHVWDAWLAGDEVPLAPYPAEDMTPHP